NLFPPCPRGSSTQGTVMLTGINPTAGPYVQSGFSVFTSQDTTSPPAASTSGTITISPGATYTVTYVNTNSDNSAVTSGNAPVDPGSPYTAGAAMTFLDNIGTPAPLALTGYTFAGWCTTHNATNPTLCTGTTFSAGTSTMPASNVTLYAQWTANTGETVTYNGNTSTGGTVPIDAGTYTTGATVTVRANTGTLVKTGYTFNDWNTQAGGGGTSYAASGAATFTISASTPLYARWTANTGETDTYNGNTSTGGTVPIDAGTYTTGATVTVRANTGTLVKTGYTFNDWNTQAGGGGTSYAASGAATFTISAS